MASMKIGGDQMRLIDADALKEELTNWAVDLTKSKFPHYIKDDADCIIDNAPTIDAYGEGYKQGRFDAEANMDYLVRCKDCIYYQDNNDGYPHDECRWRSDETPDETDFCSFAERKDND